SRSGFTSTSVARTSPWQSRKSSVVLKEVMSLLTPSFFFFSSSTVAISISPSGKLTGVGLGQRPRTGQFLVLGWFQAQPVGQHFLVVLPEQWGGAAHSARRLAQLVGDHPISLRTDRRMLQLLPDAPREELRIGEQILHCVDYGRVHAGFLEFLHHD